MKASRNILTAHLTLQPGGNTPLRHRAPHLHYYKYTQVIVARCDEKLDKLTVDPIYAQLHR